MREQIDALRRAMAAPDRRTAAILYWYALSGGLARLAVNGGDAAAVPIRSGPGGWPQLGESGPSSRPERALASAFHTLIPAVAQAADASERALWAIGTDSIASAALLRDDPQDAADELLRACGPAAPSARFEQVPGRGTVVRRGSCCLLYLCADCEKCLSCPRQTPQRRLERLS
ncbi:(2Fe-2S)-binding protein [Tsukamurella serpentis]